MEDKKVVIKNANKGVVNLYAPYNGIDIVWEKKDTKRTMSLAKLQECIWSPGVSELFTDGLLVIEDPKAFEIMQQLGLEDPIAEKPTLVILTDQQRQRLMTSAPLAEFKETFKSMNYEQRQLLADYAIEHKCTDFDRCKIIKEVIGTDVLTAIRLRDEMESAEKAANSKKEA